MVDKYMIERKTIIVNHYGMHMRPSMHISQMAEKFVSDIIISKEGDDTNYNAKSVMDLAMMGALKNQRITIKADGVDEVEAVNTLIRYIESGFAEKFAE